MRAVAIDLALVEVQTGATDTTDTKLTTLAIVDGVARSWLEDRQAHAIVASITTWALIVGLTATGAGSTETAVAERGIDIVLTRRRTIAIDGASFRRLTGATGTVLAQFATRTLVIDDAGIGWLAVAGYTRVGARAIGHCSARN